MRLAAWRICKRRYAADMWSGVGARMVAGRWHSKGTLVVYASATIALAAFETLVHLDSADLLLKFVKCPVAFDETLVRRVHAHDLPRNWRKDSPPLSLRRIGDEWARARSSVVLAVPSAVVPEEWNYMINPAHPDFGRLRVGKVTPFRFDPRLA